MVPEQGINRKGHDLGVAMVPFIRPGSIVGRIRGDADTILFVFAGSAAEFALNRAVDGLFHTGKLPADPLGRLFTTARFAQDIAFVDEETARASLHRIQAAHEASDSNRSRRSWPGVH